MNRKRRAEMAAETLEIIEGGGYVVDGERVDVSAEVERAVTGSIWYRPDEFDALVAERERLMSERPLVETVFEVENETTLAAAERLIAEGESAVLALNFASAKNPGGGFLGGSQAQEESLARSSGLYPCLMANFGMYEHNRRLKSALYSDHMIYSPAVLVFRLDDGALLARPYALSFVTAPAVNAGAVRKNSPEQVGQIGAVMRGRIEKVLTIGFVRGYETLILGAWGCGVFKNEPEVVARLFGEQLLAGRVFAGQFKRVVFAVLDGEKEQIIRPFRELFMGTNNGYS